MDSWKRFDERLLPNKKDFYRDLNMEGITEPDYKHAKKVWEDFKIKNLCDYYDLYVKSDTLLLADVCKNFRNRCIKIYELDPAHFLSAPGLACQTCLKKTEIKLKLLTDVDMLLMVEKGIKSAVCHAVNRYVKANNKYMNNYSQNIDS